MASTSYWSDQTLRDVVEALRVSLGRVSVVEIEATPQAGDWKCLQAWLSRAEQSLGQPSAPDRPPLMATFPLTGSKLRVLQATVDQIARGHLTAQTRAERIAPHSITVPLLTAQGHMRETLQRVYRSSFFLAIFLVLSLVVNVLTLVVYSGTSPQIVLGINITLAGATLGVWALHHYHLLQHHWAVPWQHARTGR